MLTAILVATAVVFGTFAERIVFAIFVLIFARLTMKALRRARSKAAAAFAPIASRATARWRDLRRRWRYAFGPTITVSAA